MDEVKFDGEEIIIHFDPQEREDYRKTKKEYRMKFLEKHFPGIIEFLSEGQLQTINNTNHYSELKAMDHFIDDGYEVYYIEADHIIPEWRPAGKKHERIRNVIKGHFDEKQQKQLISTEPGGIPDLLVGKNNKWWFVEVKGQKEKTTCKENERFPKIQKLGIKIWRARLIPENNF